MPTSNKLLRHERRRFRSLICTRSGWALVLVLISTNVVWAGRTNAVPSFSAMKVSEAIQVDGVLDEAFWARCPIGTGMIDTRTQRLADEQTTVRIAYSETHVYVGVECFDTNISQLRASERRKDRQFTADDWVEVHFDPVHSHRGKYAFFTNPLGTRADANEGPSGMFNYGWTMEWECEARIETNRWCFEMKIPFGTMNYLRRDAQTWGFNVTRHLRRTDTLSFWSYNPTESYKPRHFGHLDNMDLAQTQFDRQWEITPYASAQYDFGSGDSDMTFKVGGDIGFRLAPAITTALTINPDYGQVEADDATIELRDTERFLPEKRPFFREGEELIRMPHRLYYSRRFTDIDAGGKVTGAQQDFSFIVQDIYGTTTHQDFDGDGNSAVVRLYQHVNDRSYIGYYLADSEMAEGYSRVGGADAYFFINDRWRTSFQAAGQWQDLEDPSGTFTHDGSGDYLGDAELIYSEYPWLVSGGVKGISPGFNPLLGYIPRQNIYGPNLDLFYNRKANNHWYKELSFGYEFDYYWTESGQVSIHDHAGFGRVVLPSDVAFRASASREYHAPYQNYRVSGGFELFASDFWHSFAFSWAGGRFENIDYDELILGKPFKPWNRLPIRFEGFLRFEDQPDGTKDIKWLARAVFDLYITDFMWIKGSLQPQNDGVHNVSIIYGWEFLPRKNFYFVFNSVNNGDGTENSIFSKITWTF